MYQPTLKKILCVTYCHPVHNDLKLSKTCYPKLNLCLIETDCYSWINRWYPGCWSLTSSTVAWLLAWARVLACVTCWPPGCTLPALPPLRLSHHYHICSTHPSLPAHICITLILFNCLFLSYYYHYHLFLSSLIVPDVFILYILRWIGERGNKAWHSFMIYLLWYKVYFLTACLVAVA